MKTTTKLRQLLASNDMLVAPGAYADVIAVKGDPLREIKVLQDVQFVMKDGKVFKNDLR